MIAITEQEFAEGGLDTKSTDFAHIGSCHMQGSGSGCSSHPTAVVLMSGTMRRDILEAKVFFFSFSFSLHLTNKLRPFFIFLFLLRAPEQVRFDKDLKESKKKRKPGKLQQHRINQRDQLL